MAVSVPEREDWFEISQGLPQPRWHDVRTWLCVYTLAADYPDGWSQFVHRWLKRLRSSLGGEYEIEESAHFTLFSEATQNNRRSALAFLENAFTRMTHVLGDTCQASNWGKILVLRISYEEDYYRYLAHHSYDGESALSGGVFFPGSYPHIALQPAHWDRERGVMTHELAHYLLAHLTLPLWLDEALAMGFQNDLSGGNASIMLTPELIRRHRKFWDSSTIQLFWSGHSFQDPMGQELSYSLASVLLDILYRDIQPSAEEFRRFVQAATRDDAGAAACQQHLDLSLDELASCFLGPGNWTPDKALLQQALESQDLLEQEEEEVQEQWHEQ